MNSDDIEKFFIPALHPAIRAALVSSEPEVKAFGEEISKLSFIIQDNLELEQKLSGTERSICLGVAVCDFLPVMKVMVSIDKLNVLVAGTTGSGKTNLINFLLMQVVEWE